MDRELKKINYFWTYEQRITIQFQRFVKKKVHEKNSCRNFLWLSSTFGYTLQNSN